MKTEHSRTAFAVTLHLLLAAAATAQQHALDWASLAGGGTTFSISDEYSIGATIGQPAAGIMTNVDYTLIGGFWAIEPPCRIAGDLDHNQAVDLRDLTALLAHFGQSEGATYEDGDIVINGAVDLQDLTALLSNFGARCE